MAMSGPFALIVAIMAPALANRPRAALTLFLATP